MTTNVSNATLCGDCGAEVGPGLLACPGCARLLHRDELKTLATTAAAAEQQGELTEALSAWRRASELLPQASEQHASVQRRMQQLSAAIDGRGPAPEGVAPAAKRGGAGGMAAAAGGVGIVLLKSKALLGALFANGKLLLAGLLKLPTLLSMLVYTQWTSSRGLGFGLGIVASLYVHEFGHVAALKRYGIAASAPMFVPGFGAFVRLNQYPTDAHEEARTGLAGPLWGLVAAFVALAIGKLAASPLAISVASAGATINLFNLIPVWMLDGARGLRALNRGQRFALAAVGAGCSLVFHQWMPASVALLTFVRAFGRDDHPTGDRRMLALFSTLLVLLSAIATLPLSEGLR